MSIYSLTKASAELGIHRNTLSGWIERGCPVVSKADRSRGIDWQLNLGDIFEWRIRNAVDDALAGFHGASGQISKDEADRRKAVAQARMAEIDLDERKRSVILVADAESNMADFCQALRSGLDNVANRCAGRTSLLRDPNEIRALIEDEINRAMRVAKQLLDEKWAETRDGKPVDPDDLDTAPDADTIEEE